MAASMVSSTLIAVLGLFIYFSEYSKAFRKDIFSTKTSYHWVYDISLPVKENGFMYADFENNHCTAVKVTSLIRHGARFPGAKDIRHMSHLYQKLKLTYTNKKFSFLDKWENQFSENEEKILVDLGEDEQYFLGERFGKHLLNLFKNKMDMINFFSSSKQRTQASALAFYEGITDSVLGEPFTNMQPRIKDDVLRFHVACGKFRDSVENNKTYLNQYKHFKGSEDMQQVTKSVAERLGMKHATLDAGELKLIYFLCAFEMAIFDQEHWCHLMTDEEREIVEYHNDMKQYWKKAYGHPVISQMACPLVEEMFTSMDLLIQKQDTHSVGDFYFGHAETLAPLYAALGLFNDSEPLLANNFHRMKERAFKSSQILPFSSNIALVLYKCEHHGSSKTGDRGNDFAVGLYINEQPQKFPSCKSHICWYKEVRRRYLDHIETCSFEDVCKTGLHDEL